LSGPGDCQLVSLPCSWCLFFKTKTMLVTLRTCC
jgi:hypothetical protein